MDKLGWVAAASMEIVGERRRIRLCLLARPSAMVDPPGQVLSSATETEPDGWRKARRRGHLCVQRCSWTD